MEQSVYLLIDQTSEISPQTIRSITSEDLLKQETLLEGQVIVISNWKNQYEIRV